MTCELNVLRVIWAEVGKGAKNTVAQVPFMLLPFDELLNIVVFIFI